MTTLKGLRFGSKARLFRGQILFYWKRGDCLMAELLVEQLAGNPEFLCWILGYTKYAEFYL